ncbi:bifunctional serine/threonine-protein kinase/universal stress protein [Rhodoferax sp. BAB1]|uniref:serine/threonine protein kinase n=1 Tax=Rhodoferax sp. BAB1 TaxID=2741720 RepID=UPI0015758970|nr:bifunctional serine/threonine-protein kinase/universal stress protein [Rhodoferax sp. BAB1]QKO23028.1 protein kinase [Rhodoferax sp. BAB1]
MKLLAPGDTLDAYVVDSCIHQGSQSYLYRVHCAPGTPDPGFPLLMKVPCRGEGEGEGDEALVRFEVELQTLQALGGVHVPRFVAVGDLAQQPWLVREYLPGRTLAQFGPLPLPVDEVLRLGVALTQAVHSLHQQNTVHLDLQPAHVLVREDGRVQLLGYGLACHAHYPDLLAGQERRAVGSPAWIAPEQVLGVRGDPRSDIFAIGVLLYQLLTAELPFGAPVTAAGLRQRLWREPPPPRHWRPELPAWLQEVVLRCLAPEAAQRYPSAAHLAFDLQHPEQVRLGARGERRRGPLVWMQIRRWWRAIRRPYQPSPSAQRLITEVPIVLVAVPPQDASDALLHTLRQATARALGTRPGARLACVTVLAPGANGVAASTLQRRHLLQLRQWAQALEGPGHQTFCHVLVSDDTVQALIAYACEHRVSTIVMGAAAPGREPGRLLATVPVQVAMAAPCTVILAQPTRPCEPPVVAADATEVVTG